MNGRTRGPRGMIVTESRDVDAVAETVDALRSEARFDEALAVIGEVWPQISTVHGVRLRGLIESIPAEEWQHRPWILAAVGASYHSIDSTSRSAALPWFHAAERLISGGDGMPVSIVAGVQLHHAGVLRSLGRLTTARHASTTARESLATDVALPPPVRVHLQATAELHLGVIALHLGEYDDARRHLHLALGLGETSLVATELTECLSCLAHLAYAAGDFAQALQLIDRARTVAAEHGIARSRFVAPALATEVLIAVEQDRLVDAVALSPTLAEAGTASEWEPLAHNAIGSIAVISGRHIEGLDELRSSITATFDWEPPPNIRHTSEGMRAVLLMHLGELEEATAIFESLHPSHNHAQCPARFLAGIRFSNGDVQGALDALRECGRLGDRHSARTLVDVLLLRAAANYELGNNRIADVALDRALLTAARNGMKRPFLLVPEHTLAAMLERATLRRQPELVLRIISHLRSASRGSALDTVATLSAREREIARVLDVDTTVGQLAAALFISSNTVKTHLRSIYRKIGASTRQQAVTRLRELGLRGDPTRREITR